MFSMYLLRTIVSMWHVLCGITGARSGGTA